MTRGGPTANDDSFTVRRNASDVVLDVLGNDQVRPGTGTAITAITSPSAGGSVRIAGTTLVYSPALDFAGTETFTYTLRDQNGLDDSATVSVFVQPDLVQIRLAAAQLNGQPITRLDVGQSFLLQGFVRDISDAGGGVFAAYLDVEYPANVAAVTGSIMYGPDYPNGQSGSTSTPGLIDEVGAFDGLDQLGPNEAILFSLPMQATAAGKAVFDASPADQLPLHNVLLFGRDDPVPVEQIEYRDLTLTVGTSSNGVLSNPRNALDVNDDSNVSPLDALLVINQLNGASQALAATALGGRQSLYLDVSADGQVSPLDALLVINALNRQSSSVAAVSTALPAGQRRSDIFSALDDDSLSSVKKRAEQDALEPALDLIGRDVANGL